MTKPVRHSWEPILPAGFQSWSWRCRHCKKIVTIEVGKNARRPSQAFMRNYMKGKLNCLEGMVEAIMAR